MKSIRLQIIGIILLAAAVARLRGDVPVDGGDGAYHHGRMSRGRNAFSSSWLWLLESGLSESAADGLQMLREAAGSGFGDECFLVAAWDSFFRR